MKLLHTDFKITDMAHSITKYVASESNSILAMRV